jgi:2,5-diamino-6-(ribosylamino)-4(3H)-pyrimidinone 5'-phosphate reductase
MIDRALQKRDYETYTELEDVIHEMEDFVDAIVVEGVRDKAALKGLGVTKEIVTCSSKPDTWFVDYLRSRHKRVTILTDYDKAGKKFNKKLTARLEHAGIKVENQYRSRIGRILGLRGMRDIESVNALKKRLI